MPGLPYPLINGNQYDWSSVELNFGGVPLPLDGLKDLSYSDDLKPGKARGTHAQVSGRSRGTYDAEGSLTFYKSQWPVFLAAISAQAAARLAGYKEFAFTLTVSYSEVALGIQTDTLLGCRITKDEDQHTEGGEVLVHKCTLDILQVNWNGTPPLLKSVIPAAP